MTVDGAWRNFQGVGRLEFGHPDEIPEFDHTRGGFVLCGKRIKGVVHGQDFVVRHGRLDLGIHQFLDFDAFPPFPGAFASGFVDEDAAHRLGGGGEEMGSPSPGLTGTGEFHPRFMNQGRGLKGLPLGFHGHPSSGQLSQLLVNERQKARGSIGSASFDIRKELGDFRVGYPGRGLGRMCQGDG